MGEKTVDNILQQIQAIRRKDQRIPIGEALPVVEEVLDTLRTIPGVKNLTVMDHLRQEARLYAIRGVEPLVIYKKEGHARFDSLVASIQHDVVHTIFRVELKKEPTPQRQPQRTPVTARAGKKVRRNDPCPCGSGKKYKHCCGR